MKRAILKTVKVEPYTSGDAIDREAFFPASSASRSAPPPAARPRWP